jgi:hypothetical protein
MLQTLGIRKNDGEVHLVERVCVSLAGRVSPFGDTSRYGVASRIDSTGVILPSSRFERQPVNKPSRFWCGSKSQRRYTGFVQK